MAFFLIFLLFSINGFTTATVARDFVSPTQPLADGETLVSAGGTFALGFFSPSGSTSTMHRYVGIWFNKNPEKTIVWVANRRNPANDSTGLLSVSGNGTLTITWQNSSIIWSSSHRSFLKSPIAQLFDNGNFAVSEAFSNEFAWQSFDYPTDTLLPNQKLGWNITSGLNRNLTSWSNNDDPFPGTYTLALDLSGLPQYFLYGGAQKVWRLGHWNGLRLCGSRFMNSNIFPFKITYVDNSVTKGEVYFIYSSLDPMMVSRLVVTSVGYFERKQWSGQRWTLFMSSPDNQCDQFSTCGPFSICDENEWPICRCMEGFRPRYPATWGLSDWRGGCMRETPLDCKNWTDGFYVLKEAKLPETTYVIVDSSIGLEECRSRCLANCSCTAYASKDVKIGSGCIIWLKDLIDVNIYSSGGQDLYIRLAAVDLPRSKKWHPWRTISVAFAVLGTFLFSFLSFGCWFRRRGKNRQMQAQQLSNNDFVKKFGESEDGMPDIVIFGFSHIANATDNFSTNNKLGEGGFGPVYKGQFPYGKEVAVKRLSTRSGQGEEEFKNEILLIAKLQHRNLVRLLGCCIQREEKILVYEYMPNKSLDFYLFDPYKGRQLDWQMRLCIIEGIAQGLLYLHKHSRLRIIHRDLKASNVLLDTDMNPKISDFGLARIFSSEEIQSNTSRVVGTYGYIAPEYASHGQFSIKSDVFSYGVLMLEILSGKQNNGFYHRHSSSLTLQGYAWELWKEGKPLELVDASIADSCSMNEFLKCLHIALLCVQEKAADRPTMSDVIDMLRGDGASLANPSRPAFFIPRPAEEADSISKNSPQSIASNDLTVTIVDGR